MKVWEKGKMKKEGINQTWKAARKMKNEFQPPDRKEGSYVTMYGNRVGKH